MGPEHIGTGEDIAILNIADLVGQVENNTVLERAYIEWQERHPEASQQFIAAIRKRYPRGGAQRILHGFALALEVEIETAQVDQALALTFQDLAKNPDMQS